MWQQISNAVAQPFAVSSSHATTGSVQAAIVTHTGPFG
jgi:hypothetical protein